MPEQRHAASIGSEAGFFAVVLDLIGALVLAVYGLILGPLGFLRGPLALERMFIYLWVFVPKGLLQSAIRMGIDWRLGNFDAAIAELESLISYIEASAKKNPKSRSTRRALEDLYTLLVRAYLHSGHIDTAMQTILRAKSHLGIDRLRGLVGCDAKTAHLVRAGLAAGKLLDGGGLATMFVKANTQAPADTGQTPSATSGQRQGATAKSPTSSSKVGGTADANDKALAPKAAVINAFGTMKPGSSSTFGKVIPFRPVATTHPTLPSEPVTP